MFSTNNHPAGHTPPSRFRRIPEIGLRSYLASFKRASRRNCLAGRPFNHSVFGTLLRSSARFAPSVNPADVTHVMLTFATQNLVETAEIQQKFADAANLFLANIRTHVYLVLIRHLSAISGVLARSGTLQILKDESATCALTTGGGPAHSS